MSPIEEGESLFSKGKYELASKKFSEVAGNPFAAPADVAVSMCRLGVIKSIQNKQPEARKALQEAVESNALPSKHSAVCYYALLQILLLDKSYTDARDLVRRMGDPNLAPVYQARTWALAAEVGAKLEDSRFEVVHLQKLLGVMERASLAEIEIKILGGRKITIGDVRKRLGIEAGARTASGTFGTGDGASVQATPRYTLPLQRSFNLAGSDPAVLNLLLEIIGGDVNAAKASLEKVGDVREQMGRFESVGIGISPERISARLVRLAADDPRSLRVGIVLPIGDFYTKFNSRILRAVSIFASSSAVNGVNVSFFVKPVNPDIGSAETAAAELALDDHVHVILGPVSNSQTLGVVSVAHLLGIPVFALGPVVAAPEYASQFLVRMGVSARSQASMAVRQLATELKDMPVGVLSPNDPYGYEITSAFVASAKAASIPISGVQYYPAAGQVFRNDVEAVIGPQPSKESRKEELEELVTAAKKKAQEEKRRFDPKSVLLPPVLPFESLFLPESLARARVIASTFAFFGAENVRFIGDKQWAEGANGRTSIADPFMNGARVLTPVTGPFLSYLRRELNSPEGFLDLERQAFDALCFARSAQYRAKGNNGSIMAQVMREKDWLVEGTSLYGTVDSSGEPTGKYAVLGFKNGRLDLNLPPWIVEDKETGTVSVKTKIRPPSPDGPKN